MRRQDFDFDLPPELIAQQPPAERGTSRLLILDGNKIIDSQFSHFIDLVNSGDLLVFNDTKVIPARLFGRKATGGEVEVLIERILDKHRCLAHIRASKAPKVAGLLYMEGEIKLQVVAREGDLYQLVGLNAESLLDLIERHGHVPLPPYIDRSASADDKERYQTVYAKHKGSVAAPTAGLHFDPAMLAALQAKGLQFAFVTLHVGAGTFQPVRVDNIVEHQMHKEYSSVSAEVCAQVQATKAAKKRVIAIGTTSVRCLETAAKNGVIEPFVGDTNIFIYPGYQFKCVDAILTNFHLPQSTLLMLVAAFAGLENTKAAYQAAIKEKYRFFSYGDAMFIGKDSGCGIQDSEF